MPFVSQAQQGYLHEHPEILGKKKLAEFDAATKGKHLPKRVHSKKDSSGANYVSSNALAGNSADKEPKYGSTVPYKASDPLVIDTVKPVKRDLNPVEAARRANNQARDQRTNLGRGKGGAVPTVEEENDVKPSW